MKTIRPAYERNTAGTLLEGSPERGVDGQPLGGLYLRAEGGAALVAVVVGRDVQQVMRRFHIGPQRAVWLSAVGWDSVKVTVEQIGTLAGATSRAIAGWTTAAPPELAELSYVQTLPAGSSEVPQGAVRVIASVADAGAQQSLTLAPPLAIATPLAVGVAVEVVGDRLALTAPQTVSWILGGI